VIRRVSVLGSSISMIVRPSGGLPYPRVLEQLLNEQGSDIWLVENLSRVAATIDDLPEFLPKLVADRPDVVVIHYGHVESIFRPHSRAAWYRTFGVALGESHVDALVRNAKRTFARGRRRLGLLEQWTAIDRFERLFRDSLVYLRKETAASVIVLEANPASAKIEAWGRGSTAAIGRCNTVMRDVAHAEGARWLVLEAMLGEPLGEAIPDGTHFTGRAHAAVAEALNQEIQSAVAAGTGL
jgi:hypothetical protein